MPATATIDDPATLVLSDARRRMEQGQGMIEYAFILVLVALVVLVSVVVLGKQTGNLYSNISTGLGP
jgi:pilus assembly protein Flp/PilA